MILSDKGICSFTKTAEDYRQCYENKWRELEHFTESQRNIIDTLLARKDESEFEHTANAYMAGLLDSYRILRNFGLTLE